MYTAKNTVISPDFLVCKFCGKAQCLHSFWRIAQNYAETGGEITVFFAVVYALKVDLSLWIANWKDISQEETFMYPIAVLSISLAEIDGPIS